MKRIAFALSVFLAVVGLGLTQWVVAEIETIGAGDHSILIKAALWHQDVTINPNVSSEATDPLDRKIENHVLDKFRTGEWRTAPTRRQVYLAGWALMAIGISGCSFLILPRLHRVTA